MSDWFTKPTLDGQRVQLRPFIEDDFNAMAEAITDPEGQRLTGTVHSSAEFFPRRTSLDERGLDWYRSLNTAPDRLDLAVIDRASGHCVGEVVLNDFNQRNNACNFRILIGPKGRNRGLGSEATALIVSYGLRVLELHRIELSVYAFNPRAQHVYEKVGFQTEGVLREAFSFDGEWIDVITMSVLASDSRFQTVPG